MLFFLILDYKCMRTNIKRTKICFFIILLFSSCNHFTLFNQDEIRINEICSNNRYCWINDTMETPRAWIELYNSGKNPVQLERYSIGSSRDYSSAFPIDTYRVSPHQYIVISCGKDLQGIHTDFKVKPKKNDTIYLFRDALVCDWMELPKAIASDISYGYIHNSTQKGFLLHPTPMEENDSITSYILSEPPLFVTPGGVYTTPFYCKIRKSDDQIIRYTIDGSEPTERSPLFQDSLLITSSTVVRAKAFSPYQHPSETVTHSYLFHGRKVTLPIISICTNPQYLYNSNIGIMASPTNLSKKWKRPGNMEYFIPEKATAVLNQSVEMKIGGMSSYLLNPIKPLILSAKDPIKKKNKVFRYPFWSEKQQVEECKSIFLRSSGQDCIYSNLRDAACHESFSRYVNLDYQAYQPVIIYLNGVFKGIINLRERANEDLIQANYGIKKVDVIKNWGIVLAGDMNDFTQLKSIYNNPNSTLSSLDSLVDIECFLNMMILSYIHLNTDYPTNNVAWKEKNIPNAQWRFIAKDIDLGWGWNRVSSCKPTAQSPFLNDLLQVAPYDEFWDGAGYTTALFRKLMTFPSVRDQFIDRTIVYIGDFMRADRANAVLDSLAHNIEYEYHFTSTLYPNYPMPNYDWNKEIEYMKNWMTERIDYIPKEFETFFKLGSPFFLRIESEEEISFNDIPIHSKEWEGVYFKGRELRLSQKSNQNWIIEKKIGGKREKTIEKGKNLILKLDGDVDSVYIRIK